MFSGNVLRKCSFVVPVRDLDALRGQIAGSGRSGAGSSPQTQWAPHRCLVNRFIAAKTWLTASMTCVDDRHLKIMAELSRTGGSLPECSLGARLLKFHSLFCNIGLGMTF